MMATEGQGQERKERRAIEFVRGKQVPARVDRTGQDGKGKQQRHWTRAVNQARRGEARRWMGVRFLLYG